MIDFFENQTIEEVINQSIEIHDLLLEKIINKKYIFMTGYKGILLDFIEDFELDAEPLQINGEIMMHLKRNDGGFHHTYFVKKDKNLRHALDIFGRGNPKSIKANFDLLIGFVLRENTLSHLQLKEDEEFNVRNVESHLNAVYPIATVDEMKEFNKRANDLVQSWSKMLKQN